MGHHQIGILQLTWDKDAAADLSRELIMIKLSLMKVDLEWGMECTGQGMDEGDGGDEEGWLPWFNHLVGTKFRKAKEVFVKAKKFPMGKTAFRF